MNNPRRPASGVLARKPQMPRTDRIGRDQSRRVLAASAKVTTHTQSSQQDRKNQCDIRHAIPHSCCVPRISASNGNSPVKPAHIRRFMHTTCHVPVTAARLHLAEQALNPGVNTRKMTSRFSGSFTLPPNRNRDWLISWRRAAARIRRPNPPFLAKIPSITAGCAPTRPWQTPEPAPRSPSSCRRGKWSAKRHAPSPASPPLPVSRQSAGHR